MANPNYSVAELESLLKEQKSRLESLKKEQSKLQKELDSVNAEIASLSGKGRRGRPAGSKNVGTKKVKRKRPKNAKSLRKFVTDLLNDNKKGLQLQELHDSVLAAGYKSKSKNFKNVLYQCLYNNDEFVHDEKSGAYKLQA